MGLRFCARAFSSCGKWGLLFIAVRRPLLLRSTGSRRASSVIVAHGLSCSTACGIFPDQGSNPCPLHWQADSQPLCHQGSPTMWSFVTGFIHIAVSFRVIHVVACISTLFFSLLNNNPMCGYTIFCLTIYQLRDIWIIPFLAIMNNAAMKN